MNWGEEEKGWSNMAKYDRSVNCLLGRMCAATYSLSARSGLHPARSIYQVMRMRSCPHGAGAVAGDIIASSVQFVRRLVAASLSRHRPADHEGSQSRRCWHRHQWCKRCRERPYKTIVDTVIDIPNSSVNKFISRSLFYRSLVSLCGPTAVLSAP